MWLRSKADALSGNTISVGNKNTSAESLELQIIKKKEFCKDVITDKPASAIPV